VTTPTRYRKRPVEVDAIQWTGQNTADVGEFTAGRFRLTLPAVLRLPALGEVYDFMHDTWVKLAVGSWIVRGVRGECYPVEASVFAETYEQVTP
jgi:hypothetical protein